MKLKELKTKLINLSFNEKSYSICEGVKDECYIIEPDSKEGYWFFYSERGLRRGEQFFNNEEDVASFLFQILNNDKTVKRG